MPQKKNADGLELIRGKTARIVGNVSLLSVERTKNLEAQSSRIELRRKF